MTYQQLQAAITAAVYPNATGDITGNSLQTLLLQIASYIKDGEDYVGNYDSFLPKDSSIDVVFSGNTLTLTFTGRLCIFKKPSVNIITSAADGQTFTFSGNQMLTYNATNDTFALYSDGHVLAEDELYMLQWNQYSHTYIGILARLIDTLTKANYLPTVKYKQPFDCFLPANSSINKEIAGNTLTLTFTGRLCIFSKPDVSIITTAADSQTFTFSGNQMLVYEIDNDTFTQHPDGYSVKSNELYMLQWNKTTHTYIGILARLLDTLDIIALSGLDIAGINSRTRASGIKYNAQAFDTDAFGEFLEPTGQGIGQNMILDMFLFYSQSAACYGDLALIMQDNHGGKHILVNMQTLEKVQDIPVTVKPYQEQHNNSATFSSVFYDAADPFPLLYLSSIYDSKVYVMRITEADGVYSMSEVQVIQLPTSASFGFFPDAFVDGSDLWVNAYKENSTTSATNNAIVFRKFALPAVDEDTPSVTLTDADILDTFETTFYAYKQDGFVLNDKLYQGCGNSGAYPTYLTCYDLTAKEELDKVTLPRYTNGNRLEPEGTFAYDGNIYMYRKSGDESIPRGLYIIKLKNE